MKKIALFILLFSISFLAQAQQSKQFKLNFKAMYNDEKLQLDTVQYLLPNTNDSVSISNLKFYISNITLFNNTKKVYTEKKSYHLIDVTNNSGLEIALKTLPSLHFNRIEFNLGIDSATNSKGVLGKDLDPTKGMYWAWHSGYINIKLEGKSKVCATRNNVFQFHLGGYKSPNNNLQKVRLKLSNNSKAIIEFDIYKFLETIDLATTNEIMTPSKIAVELSKKAAAVFGIRDSE